MKKLFLIAACIVSIGLYAQNKPTTTQVHKSTPVKKPAVVAVKPHISHERLIEITTDYGVMVARLYDSTPKNRDNFVSKVQAGFYDSLLFHRIIKEFMIQGGDPTSKYATDSSQLGGGDAPGPRIDAEIRPDLIHKKGVLASARDGNPEKAGSNCQFYIVQGKKYDSAALSKVYQRVKSANPAFNYTATQSEIYQRLGGTPFLDQNYTVFGEVISGLDVIDKIAAVQTRPGDRPVKDVRMKIRLLN